MITKNENFIIPLSGEECSIGLVNTTILLLNLRGWEIVEAETGNTEDATVVGLIKCNTNGCHINIVATQFGEKETKFSINAKSEMHENIDDKINEVKKCVLFALDARNKGKIDEARQRVDKQLTQILNKKLLHATKEAIRSLDKIILGTSKMAEELKVLQDPSYHYSQATNILKQVVFDIDQSESQYWDKIQPFPKYTEDILKGIGAEEELNLALGIGLDGIDAARAKFILMSLWLTKQVVEGKINWQAENEVQNLPYLRPFAREIVSLTKKYLLRYPQSLDALKLQKVAYQYLQNFEGVGESEHAIAKIKILIKAGFIEIEKEASQEEKSAKQRNDGKALEDEVKELLQSMGLNAATTRTTGDGGIDIIAYSDSPLFSGKYVVQCKDWAGSVGESVIRDLYGVVTAESANKGILITTGTITKSAQKFADGKPLELIDGEQLSKLLHKFKPS